MELIELTLSEINKDRLIIGLVLLFMTVAINLSINIRKERRDIGRWQLGNVKDFLFDKYLTDEVKNNRQTITENQHLNNPKSKEKYEITIIIQ